MAADNGGIGADCCSSAHPCFGILVPPNHHTSRVADIGKNTAWAEEHIVLTFYARIEAHIVLDLTIPTESDIRTDDHILPDVAAFAKDRPRHDVAEVPDFRPRPNLTAIIDYSCFVCEPIVLLVVTNHLL